jgi:hypothetical protein
MTAALAGLSVLAYAQGFTLWHYRSPHPLAAIGQGGYFAPAAGLFEAGDMMLVSAADGGGLFLIAATEPVALAPLGATPPKARPLRPRGRRGTPPAPAKRGREAPPEGPALRRGP